MKSNAQGQAPSTKPVVQVSPFQTLREMYEATVVFTCGEDGFDMWASGLSQKEIIKLLRSWLDELCAEVSAPTPSPL